MLLELHKKLGNKWVEMTRVIKGRTVSTTFDLATIPRRRMEYLLSNRAFYPYLQDNAVKNRFIAITRKCMYRERKNARKEIKFKAPVTNKSGVLSHTAKSLNIDCNSLLESIVHDTFQVFQFHQKHPSVRLDPRRVYVRGLMSRALLPLS